MTIRNVAPREYVHGRGVIKAAGNRVRRLGRRAVLMGGTRALRVVLEHGLRESLEASGLVLEVLTPFQGHCTTGQIQAYREAAEKSQADVILGAGGGSVLDCTKAVAAALSRPVVSIPTSPAQCAATSPISILYTEGGAWTGTLQLPACPEAVLVDDEVVASAPVRMFRSGIADALAKPYEVRLAVESGMGDGLVKAALAVAREILDQLQDKAEPLVRMLERRGEPSLPDPESEAGQLLADVIDACIFLPGMVSGAAGNKARLSVAHAVHNALTQFESVHALYHGEIVAYGIAVQLTLEERLAELEEFAGLMKRIGLVSNLEVLGLRSPERVEGAVEHILKRLEGLETPFDCSAAAVQGALLRADAAMSRGTQKQVS